MDLGISMSENNLNNFVEITPEDSVVPVYIIPLTDEDLEIHKQVEADELKRAEDAASREAAKESALKKLSKLGLTEDEAKAIIGV